MSPPADVVFYVSGHGFGHASRDIEIVNAIRARRPEVRIQVRTYAARWLFDLTVSGVIDYQRCACDTGVVQVDSLRPDLEATVAALRAFYGRIDERIDAEAAAISASGARLVLADLPPLALAAAHRAGVPAVAIGNFTWDWIYDGYARLLADAAWVPGWMRGAHGLADEAWRLPMHGGFGGFRVVRDLPLVARHSRRERGAVRRALGLRPDTPAILVSFGGFGLEASGVTALDRLGDLDILMADTRRAAGASAGPAASVVTRDHNVVTVNEHAWYGAGYRYEDLVHAADVVVTKPGYGIIAECVANDTALVYTSRGEFAEYDVLVAALQRHVRSAFLSNTDLRTGRWRHAIEDALAQPRTAWPTATNGAEIAADWAIARL